MRLKQTANSKMHVLFALKYIMPLSIDSFHIYKMINKICHIMIVLYSISTEEFHE